MPGRGSPRSPWQWHVTTAPTCSACIESRSASDRRIPRQFASWKSWDCDARDCANATYTSTVIGAITSRTSTSRVMHPMDSFADFATRRDSHVSRPTRPKLRAVASRLVTGLIYVVIIALWGAVLIPIWLRRHDQISEVRSTARFQSAMSSLGRQQRLRNSARQQAARRRATVLGVLTLLLASTLILGVMSMAPIWLAFVAAGLLLAYIVATAMTANQRTTAATRRPRAEPAPEVVEESVDVVVEEAPAAPSRRRMKSLAEDEEFVRWNAWDEDDAWEAIPQTLPTYVNAPRASSVPRRIDRAHDGDWSGSAMVRAAQQVRRPHTDEVIADHHASTQEIPAVGDRRAVNE
jgi:hypothetical protein